MKAQIGKRYRHYKGKEYVVLNIARNTETLEDLVVYQAQYDTPDFGSKPVWIRPKDMFEETVEVDGVQIDRFIRVD
ncbi:MAG: hypothetical protein ACI9VM_000917 [Candidatus Azotimanducaceae bacterium]|jgi:hypothetical protein